MHMGGVYDRVRVSTNEVEEHGQLASRAGSMSLLSGLSSMSSGSDQKLKCVAVCLRARFFSVSLAHSRFRPHRAC